MATSLKSVACPLDYRCGRNKIIELETQWKTISVSSSQDGIENGELCSYQLKVPKVGGKAFIEIEAISIQNVNVNVYVGYEALLQGSSSTISAVDEVKQFDSSQVIFLVADFTDDSSSFLIEYRMSSIILDATTEKAVEPEVEEITPVPILEVKIAKEELYYYLFLAVATILILAILCTIFIKLCQSIKPKEVELSRKNTDVLVLERLNTVRKVSDPKYAAKTREEMRREIAEDMDKEGSKSESEIEEEEKEETKETTWETVIQPVVPNKKTSRVRQRNTKQITYAITQVIEEESDEDIVD